MTPTTAARPRTRPITDPFTAGALIAGLIVGLPASVALGIIAGEVFRAALIPAAAVAVTVALARREGVTWRDALSVRVRRADVPGAAAGAVTAVVGVALLLLGGVR